MIKVIIHQRQFSLASIFQPKLTFFFLMSVLGAKQGQIKNLVALEFKYDKLIDTKNTKNNVDLLRNKIIN